MPTPEQMSKLFQAVEATARYAAVEEEYLSVDEECDANFLEHMAKVRAKAAAAQLDCTKSWCG